MSTAMWKLEKDLCRCCHAEGSFKHLSDPCFLLGQEEIYSVMLQDCLDIKIDAMTGPLSDATYTICESCVVRLRDASNFKRQVQDCEERFKDMYNKNLIKGSEVKEEPCESEADMKTEFLNTEDDDDDDDDAFMKFEDDGDDDDDDSYEEHEEMVTVEIEGEPRAKGKGKAKPQPKPKPKKAAPVKKTKPKEKPIKVETEDLTEAAVSGEKKKDEEKHRMKACFNCKKIRKVEDLGDSNTCPDCSCVLTNCVVRLVREQLQEGPITNFFITTDEENNGPAKPAEPQPAGSSTGGPAPASVLRDYLLQASAGNSKEDDNATSEKIGEQKDNKDSDDDSLESIDMDAPNIEIYECVECQRTFNRKSSLTVHIRRTHLRVEQKCPDCSETFLTKRSLQTHAKQFHDKDTEPETGSRFKYQDFINVVKGLTTVFACRLCEFKFEKRSSLVHHIRSGHMQQLTCHVCNKIFSDEKLLQAHKSQPHPMKYPCKLCELSFATVAKLKSHKTHHHAKVRCTICPDVLFTNYNNRKTHMFSFHKDLLPTCGVCGLKGMSQNRIDQHQQKVHLKEKNVTCSVCQYQCYGYSQLKRHMIRHKVEKVYSCRFCKKTFPRPTTCRIHEMIHTGEKNKVCELCDAAFVQKASLNYHMIKHHPDHV